MKKHIIWGFIAGIIIIPVAWYLISPIWNVVEVDDASPLIEERMQNTGMLPAGNNEDVKDALMEMDDDEKQTFREAVDMAMKEPVKEMVMEVPAGPTLEAQGVFKPRAHEVEGVALLIDGEKGKTLRFEDFETINGPNLHIYLASDLSDTDFVDLGPIKATKGNVNYEIPENVDTDIYNKVLVWCVPFKVLFSYAELQ